MSRVAAKLSCTKEQEKALSKLARSRTEETRLVERAKIVLACLTGKRNDQIAAEMKLRPNTVGIWRNRFATQGLSGLHDQACSGKPSAYDCKMVLWKRSQMPFVCGWRTLVLVCSMSFKARYSW